jgi:dTDP-D-glucose 4,6-dehydratase
VISQINRVVVFQEMTSAKITRCRHYFHGVCLRKWLYVQDKCPLCHEIIINQDATATSKNNEAENENINNHNIEVSLMRLVCDRFAT